MPHIWLDRGVRIKADIDWTSRPIEIAEFGTQHQFLSRTFLRCTPCSAQSNSRKTGFDAGHSFDGTFGDYQGGRRSDGILIHVFRNIRWGSSTKGSKKFRNVFECRERSRDPGYYYSSRIPNREPDDRLGDLGKRFAFISEIFAQPFNYVFLQNKVVNFNTGGKCRLSRKTTFGQVGFGQVHEDLLPVVIRAQPWMVLTSGTRQFWLSDLQCPQPTQGGLR